MTRPNVSGGSGDVFLIHITFLEFHREKNSLTMEADYSHGLQHKNKPRQTNKTKTIDQNHKLSPYCLIGATEVSLRLNSPIFLKTAK